MVYLGLIAGLCLLIYGGNTLVNGSVAVATRMGVSPLLVGLVLVGFGTSTPELVASLISAFEKAEGIAVGNVVGSNIANILLVLGAAAVIRPIQIDKNSFKRDGFFLILATAVLVGVALWGIIGHFVGMMMVAVLLFYIIYSYRTDRLQQKEISLDVSIDSIKNKPTIVPFLLTALGIALTLLGAKLLVDNAIILAQNWGVSQTVIGLTVVAVGTSLPELAASVISSFKKQNGVAFGNVVGSNIYNALFILGMTALFMPIQVPPMTFDLVVMVLSTLALTGIAFFRGSFSRIIGFCFLGLYVGYVFYLF